jgi:hypothetical protein
MLDKAWRSLKARFGNRQRDPLRLSVHRGPMYPSVWQPITLPDGRSCLQVEIYLEVSNNTGRSSWIAAAELVDLPTLETTVVVRDPRTHVFAPDNALLPRLITTVSLRFLVVVGPIAADEPFRATLALTDHLGGRHSTQVIMH